MRGVSRRSAMAGIAASLLAGCGGTDHTANALQAAKDRTVPAGGAMLNSSPLRREGQSLTAAWEIETRMTWSAYADGVARRFHDYRISERSEQRLALTKQLPGDALTLVLTRIGVGDGPCKVSAEFVAAPS